jgi:hypothetical protein
VSYHVFDRAVREDAFLEFSLRLELDSAGWWRFRLASWNIKEDSKDCLSVGSASTFGSGWVPQANWLSRTKTVVIIHKPSMILHHKDMVIKTNTSLFINQHSWNDAFEPAISKTPLQRPIEQCCNHDRPQCLTCTVHIYLCSRSTSTSKLSSCTELLWQ